MGTKKNLETGRTDYPQLLLEGRIKPGDRLSALLDENGIVLTVA